MSHYLFIQSQDPFTEVRAGRQFQFAGELAQAGHDVHVLLMQNGVTPARQNADSADFDRLLDSGVTVSADDFSLAQRQIANSELKERIAIRSADTVIDAMLDGHKVIWN